MQVSIIIAVYKDIEALKLIISALRQQDYHDFEIIIAEDGKDKAMSDYIASLPDNNITHTTQEDKGIRKARSLNNAILESKGDYIIFIDGDCIPYTNFISNHIKLAENGRILSGRRVNLSPAISSHIRKGTLKPATLQKYYLFLYPYIIFTGTTHAEQGISFNPEGWLYQNILLRRKRTSTTLLGCNFSCFKEALYKVDGFDESYIDTAVADDTDIQWRLERAGYKIKSCKLSANVFHLYHTFRQGLPHEANEIKKMQKRKETHDYTAAIGISSHS